MALAQERETACLTSEQAEAQPHLLLVSDSAYPCTFLGVLRGGVYREIERRECHTGSRCLNPTGTWKAGCG